MHVGFNARPPSLQRARATPSSREPVGRGSISVGPLRTLEESMKNFLAIYLGSESSRSNWNKLDEKTRQDQMSAGMKAWGDWMVTHKASVIVEGNPLGKTKRTS